MDSRQIQSRRNSIYDAQRELDRQYERLENELIDLQAQCPHENKRPDYAGTSWYCQDCDKEFEYTEDSK